MIWELCCKLEPFSAIIMVEESDLVCWHQTDAWCPGGHSQFQLNAAVEDMLRMCLQLIGCARGRIK